MCIGRIIKIYILLPLAINSMHSIAHLLCFLRQPLFKQKSSITQVCQYSQDLTSAFDVSLKREIPASFMSRFMQYNMMTMIWHGYRNCHFKNHLPQTLCLQSICVGSHDAMDFNRRQYLADILRPYAVSNLYSIWFYRFNFIISLHLRFTE